MEENQKALPTEEKEAKSNWQSTKEGWYDKVPLTVKQLDAIIIGGLVALVVVFGLIFLESVGIFSLFG